MRPPNPPSPPLPHRPSLCRFGYGMGLTLVGKSDQSTGNHHFASYILQSGAHRAAALPHAGLAALVALRVVPTPAYRGWSCSAAQSCFQARPELDWPGQRFPECPCPHIPPSACRHPSQGFQQPQQPSTPCLFPNLHPPLPPPCLQATWSWPSLPPTPLRLTRPTASRPWSETGWQCRGRRQLQGKLKEEGGGGEGRAKLRCQSREGCGHGPAGWLRGV